MLEAGKWASIKIGATLTRVTFSWLDDWVRTSPKQQIMWGVIGRQCFVPTNPTGKLSKPFFKHGLEKTLEVVKWSIHLSLSLHFYLL